jgi:chromosome segregation ATPase
MNSSENFIELNDKMNIFGDVKIYINNLEQQIKYYEIENNNLINSNNILKKEKIELNELLKEKEITINEQISLSDNLKKENEDLKKENEDFKNENENLKKENEDFKKRILDLEKKVNELNGELTEKNKILQIKEQNLLKNGGLKVINDKIKMYHKRTKSLNEEDSNNYHEKKNKRNILKFVNEKDPLIEIQKQSLAKFKSILKKVDNDLLNKNVLKKKSYTDL